VKTIAYKSQRQLVSIMITANDKLDINSVDSEYSIYHS